MGYEMSGYGNQYIHVGVTPRETCWCDTPAACWNWGEWGLKRVKMKGVLPWLVNLACRAGKRDFCSALAALVGQVQSIFSPPYTISMPLSLLPKKVGKQPCWVACLLVCVSGDSRAQQDVIYRVPYGLKL